MTRSWEIEGFLELQNHHLYIDGVDAVELAREHGTPLFVFSENRIRHNIDRLKKVQDVIGCPLKLCYAAKAMSTMGILKAVKDAGCDIEVNSGGELWKALEIGFTGDRIIFNGTSKEVWEIENAINAEIYAIQVDSLYELSLIEQTARRLGKRANVSLRMVPEIDSQTHSGLQTALLTSKFGMMPGEAFAAFRDNKDSPNLNLCGIHLHVGSQNPDMVVYTEALETLFANLAQIQSETGTRLSHVNLGGGFPVNYIKGGNASNSECPPTLATAIPPSRTELLSASYEPADALKAAWQKLSGRLLTENPTLIDDITILLEPGRSIVADAGICLTTVQNTKERPMNVRTVSDERNSDPPPVIDNWLLTDAGFNILLSMETYKWYYHLISAGRAGEDHNFPYKLGGPLCDGGDVYFDVEGEGRLPDYRLLPQRIKPGEILALLNCGAYSIAQASQYNGRFVPAVVVIRRNGTPLLTRRRDSFGDLVSNDVY